MRLEAGEELVLESNVFVECILPSNVIRASPRRRWKSTAVLTASPANPIVLVQEDSPREIGEAVVDFISQTGA